MSNIKKSLKDRAKEFSVQLPFMDGKDKGENRDILGQVVTITEYGFLPNDDGEVYAVFTIKERPNKFYFGGSVLTDRLFKLEEEGYHDEIVNEGLPMVLTEKRAKKSNRTYTNVEFYPEN